MQPAFNSNTNNRRKSIVCNTCEKTYFALVWLRHSTSSPATTSWQSWQIGTFVHLLDNIRVSVTCKTRTKMLMCFLNFLHDFCVKEDTFLCCFYSTPALLTSYNIQCSCYSYSHRLSTFVECVFYMIKGRQ
jgi:hypothetical protein